LLAGLEQIHRRFATREWSELVEPAIALAHEGFERDEQRVFLHADPHGILQRDEGGSRIYGDPERVQTATPARRSNASVMRDRGCSPSCFPRWERPRGLPRSREGALELAILGRQIRSMPTQGGTVVRRILELLAAHEGDPLLEAEARAVADAYGPLGSGPLPGTTHISVVDAGGLAAASRRRWGRARVCSVAARSSTTCWRARRHRPRPERGRRAAREHDDADARPRSGRPELVIGSAGSVRLAGAIAQVTWRFLRGMHVLDAICAPRLHVEGTTVHLEGGWPDADVAALPASWDVNRWDGLNLFFGGVQAVERTAQGAFEAAGDPRRGGVGMVVA
jgi:gamma-glutamyltranspeptidase